MPRMTLNDKIMFGKPLTKKEWKMEFRRGYNSTLGLLSAYRSLWVEEGWIWGYTLRGVKHKLFAAADRQYRGTKQPFVAGHAKALREGLRKKPKGRLPKRR